MSGFMVSSVGVVPAPLTMVMSLRGELHHVLKGCVVLCSLVRFRSEGINNVVKCVMLRSLDAFLPNRI